ncbi:MAG: hypothetical protein LC750_04550 [Actinobacteria bacterium]|nr:hypothetical protein [Actinomycetota bacterium]
MRAAIVTAACAGVVANVGLGLRLMTVRARANVAPPGGDETGVARRVLAPMAPPAAFICVSIAVLWRPETYSAVAAGLLLTSAAAALVIPPLATGLLFWSHAAERASRDEETAWLPQLQRLGSPVDEVWVSKTPVVAYWRAQLLCPALVVGHRLLLWHRMRTMGPETVGGIALGRPGMFWPWALFPLAVGALRRAADPTSALPWWLFGAAGGLIALTALPSFITSRRTRAAIRSDASVPHAIQGLLEIGAIESELVASRGGGRLTDFGIDWVSERAIRRARRAASRAQLPDETLEQMLNEYAPTTQ